MKIHISPLIAYVLLLAIAEVSCAHRTLAEQAASPPPRPALLGPSDILEIRVFGEPDLTGTYQISGDGTFDYPLIGRLKGTGRTEGDLATEITQRLQDGFLKNPQVSIFIKEQRSRKVTVLGEVQKPGTFNYVEHMSVMEAISLAGGFTQLAAKNDTVVTRSGRRFRVAVELIAEGRVTNFFLEPGDTLLVPERIF